MDSWNPDAAASGYYKSRRYMFPGTWSLLGFNLSLSPQIYIDYLSLFISHELFFLIDLYESFGIEMFQISSTFFKRSSIGNMKNEVRDIEKENTQNLWEREREREISSITLKIQINPSRLNQNRNEFCWFRLQYKMLYFWI